ncbi:MAG: hypothetical protein ACRCZ5_01065 [Burkholderiales bacterium]|jgi:hypothetical protein
MLVFSILCKTPRKARRALIVHVSGFVDILFITLYLVFLFLCNTNSSDGNAGLQQKILQFATCKVSVFCLSSRAVDVAVSARMTAVQGLATR